MAEGLIPRREAPGSAQLLLKEGSHPGPLQLWRAQGHCPLGYLLVSLMSIIRRLT